MLAQLLFYLFALLALLLSGLVPLLPLLYVGLALATLGAFYAISPYW